LDAFDLREMFKQGGIVQKAEIGRAELRALTWLIVAGSVKRNSMSRAAFYAEIRLSMKRFIHVILFSLSVFRQGAIIYNAKTVFTMFF
jgi:hypothetical protein